MSIHIHDHQAASALARGHLPAGVGFDADGMTAALAVVARLINDGAIDTGHVEGCDVCEHPMGHGKEGGFAFTRRAVA